jgi:hypothetical protein
MSVMPIKPVELMNGDFTDFVGVWDKHVPPSVCNKLIQYFDKVVDTDSSSNNFDQISSDVESVEELVVPGEIQFASKNLGRDDRSIMLNYHQGDFCSEVNQYLQSCFLDYIRQYGQLAQIPMVSTDVKMQRTGPCGGYHMWHYESGSYHHAQRELVWMIYLNSLPEGEGETEFLYQKRRISPKQGTCVIWPAGMTHVHRGLTVYSQNKYILTGWYIKTPTLK